MLKNLHSCLHQTLQTLPKLTNGKFVTTLCIYDEAADACASAPCENSGTCTNAENGGFTCDCSGTGYTGDVCETSKGAFIPYLLSQLMPTYPKTLA